MTQENSNPSGVSITFVTGNDMKCNEAQDILGSLVDLKRSNIDLMEVQGDPEQVACEKCKLAKSFVNGPVLVEDTSLCFHALNGLPGVYIKSFLEKLGVEGVVDLLKNHEDKSGYAQVVLAFSLGIDEPIFTFVGRTAGQIVEPKTEVRPMDWDSIFQPLESGQTFAEMSQQMKNSMSPRRVALDQLRLFLKELDELGCLE